jgi:hypothetical protein
MVIEIITLVISFIIAIYLIGQYIINPQSLPAKSITVGFEYLASI